ncbi:MAG: cytochrome c [Betaproteobacteria bacterium]|nr:cytochrome c [Betaproteobacteria bacterium]
MNPIGTRFALSLAACAALVTGTAQAQSKPEDDIRYRQSVMNVMGRALGPLGAMAQGKAPFNAAVAQKNAMLVDTLLSLPFNAYGPGTDKGAPTKADPKIWSDAARFKQSSEVAQKAAAQLLAASNAGDEARFKAAVGEVGKACKSCHDDFRTKEFRN